MPTSESRTRWLLPAVICLFATTLTRADTYPDRPIVLVCPWAAGGGTDRVSRMIAAHLESEFDCPVSVINATGGKGVTGHSRGLRARPDGYTITMATLELNMMHWTGLTSLTVDDCIPLMSVNEDYAALFVMKDAPWQTLQDFEAAIRANPKQIRASGTTGGAAWHVAMAGWLVACGLPPTDITWVASTGAGPSLQEMMSGGVDAVCCALPEASSLHDAGAIRALGVMAPNRLAEYPNIPTFTELGYDWSLGGWRAIVVPKHTPAPVCDKLRSALERIVTGQTELDGVTFPQFMQQSGFDHTYRSGQDLVQFLTETDQKFGELMTSEAMRAVNRDRYNAQTFPRILIAALSVVGLSIAGQWWMTRNAASGKLAESPAATLATARGKISFALIVAVIVGYVLAAERVGFVLYSVLTLWLLISWMGGRVWSGLGLSVAGSAAIYQIFVHGLRVPLPRGWLGW